MDAAIELLTRLADAASKCASSLNGNANEVELELYYQELIVACPISKDDVESLRSLTSEDQGLWRRTAELGISLEHAVRTLTAHMQQGSTLDDRLVAGSLVTALLAAPSCPVATIYNERLILSLVRILRQASGANHVAALLGDDDMEEGDAIPHAEEDLSTLVPRHVPQLLTELRVALEHLSLRDSVDIVKMLIEALLQLAATGGAYSSDVTPHCYRALLVLPHVRHGNVKDILSHLFHSLSTMVLANPTLGALSGASKKQKGAPSAKTLAEGARRSAINFAAEMARSSLRAREAVAALMRHVCLKSCQKAELRVVALETAACLMPSLSPVDQYRFVLFLARLSRTQTVNHRLVAVEIAAELILNFEGAFQAHATDMALTTGGKQHEEQDASGSVLREGAQYSGGSAPTGTPSSTVRTSVKKAFTTPLTGSSSLQWRTPAPMSSSLISAAQSLPVGVLCAAVLMQRCSDRAPTVRARALTLLGTVVREMTSCVEAEVAIHILALMDRLAEEQPGDFGSALRTAGLISTNVPSRAGMTTVVKCALAGEGGGGEEEEEDAGGAGRDGQAGGDVMTEGGGVPALKAASTHLPAAERAVRELRTLLKTARRRAADDKGVVRRAALSLLETLLSLTRSLRPALEAAGAGKSHDSLALDGPTQEDVDVIIAATSDLLVTVRRAALAALVELYRTFASHPHLPHALLRVLLTTVRDTEGQIVDASLGAWQQLVLDPLSSAIAKREGGKSTKVDHQAEAHELSLTMALRLVEAVGELGSAVTAPFLTRCMSMLKQQKALQPRPLAQGLAATTRRIDVSESTRIGAWLLLAELTTLDAKCLSWEFLLTQWNDMAHATKSTTAVVLDASSVSYWSRAGVPLLRAVGHCAATFPPSETNQIASTLFTSLRSMTLGTTQIMAYVATLSKLSAVDAAAVQNASAMVTWTREVLDAAETELSNFVEHLRRKPEEGDGNNSFSFGGGGGGVGVDKEREGEAPLSEREEKARAAIFVVGEVALLRSSAASSRLQMLCQALTVPRLAAEVGGGGREAARVPSLLQALAWITVGKLGLVSESLAKRLVPLLVQELSASRSAAVRNNIMVALSDLCVHYTALVDAHMHRLVACIHDDCPIVRKHALALLVRLLASDYVKCRGPLFHQLLLALADPEDQVRHVAEYLIRETLSSKLPQLAYNHFIEAIFILNKCQPNVDGSGDVNTLSQQEDEAGGGTLVLSQGGGTSLSQFEASGGTYPLAGATNASRASRRRIYRCLLTAMGLEHRAATAAKVSSLILARAAEGSLKLEGNADELIMDALYVLASGLCRVGNKRATLEEDEAEGAPQPKEGGGDKQGPTEKIRGALLSTLMKKQMSEGIIPVLVSLRARLIESRHERLRHVMETLVLLCREYKSELDTMVEDKVLVKELLYEMKQLADGNRVPSILASCEEEEEPGAGGAGAGVTTGRVVRRGVKRTNELAGLLPAGVSPGAAMAMQQREAAMRRASVAGNAPLGMDMGTGAGGKMRRVEGGGVSLPGVSPQRTPLAAQVLLEERMAARSGSAAKGVATLPRTAGRSGGAPGSGVAAEAAALTAAKTILPLGTSPLVTPKVLFSGTQRKAARIQVEEGGVVMEPIVLQTMDHNALGPAME